MKDTSISPIFTSSLELLEHAIEHLKKSKPRDLKFAVLHADNAIELILKDLARSNGIRIMTKKGGSISYYDCIGMLETKGITVPKLPDIDILHTERNSIYHLGSQPHEKKTEWLVYEVALNLVSTLCSEYFNYDLKSFSTEFSLSSNTIESLELTRSEITNRYQKEALTAFNNNLFNFSIVASYTSIEVFLREGIPIDLRQGFKKLETLIDDNLISREELREIILIRNLRNKILHQGYSSTKEEATFALETSRRIIGGIDSVLM